jgi:hypothetical protein
MSGSLNPLLTALAQAITCQNGRHPLLRVRLSDTPSKKLDEEWPAGEELRKLLSVSNQPALQVVKQVRAPLPAF